jgi:hypothetical protein
MMSLMSRFASLAHVAGALLYGADAVSDRRGCSRVPSMSPLLLKIGAQGIEPHSNFRRVYRRVIAAKPALAIPVRFQIGKPVGVSVFRSNLTIEIVADFLAPPWT